jgi:hypothetical protein
MRLALAVSMYSRTPADQTVLEFEYEAVIVVVGVAVCQCRTQALFDDHGVTVCVEAAKLCGKVGNEKLVHFGCEHAGDLVPADDVPRPFQGDSRCIACWSKPLGIFRKYRRDLSRVARSECLPRRDGGSLVCFGIHRASLLNILD